MKKIIFRVLSYILDMMIITGITTVFAVVMPFSNYRKINKLQEDVYKYVDKVVDVITLLDADGKYMEDNTLSEKEFKNISKKYKQEFDIYLEDIVDKELTVEELNKVTDKISQHGTDYINKEYYKISKLNIVRNIFQLIIVILYFGIIQFALKGQTVGKLAFKLYVVDAKDETKKVPMYKYLLRSLLVTTSVFSIISTILAISLKYNTYMTVNKYFSFLVQTYSLVMAMFILFRDDQKGFHDLLLGTRVKMLNSDGSEYTKVLFMDTEVKEEVKEVKTTKKKSTKKKTTKNEKSNNKNN